VSADTMITGMSYSVGGEPAIAATMHHAEAAALQYSEIVERARDPALLRLVSRSDRLDDHQLAVYPISRGMPARVTITMLLPPATQLVFDPVARRLARVDVTLDGKQTRWTNIKSPTVLELAPPRDEGVFADPAVKGLHVDETTSLFADDEPDREKPVLVERREQRMPTVSYSDRRFELRRLIRAHAKQLGHCYAYAALKDPQRSPAATLAVDVAADGRVSRADVFADADKELSECIESEIETWQLRAADQARSVRQDIDLLHLD